MKIPTKKLSINLEDFMGVNEFALLNVAPIYDYVDGKKTDTITSIRYSVANARTFETFDVKIQAKQPIITQREIDNADERLFVSFENAIIRPYKIEFGKAVCSVTADSVKLVSMN